MNIEDCKSIKDLARFVSQYLHDKGIDFVLTGGACICIYSNEKYKSNDLDFVNMKEKPISIIKKALGELGFEEKGRIFIHRKIKISIDILGPPLTVGEEHITEINEIREEGGLLKLLLPTDSVKDRLAAFYHWNDYQALGQAIMVCQEQEIDFENIRKWSIGEGMSRKFDKFINELKLN